jgi:hypothetical protein
VKKRAEATSAAQEDVSPDAQQPQGIDGQFAAKRVFPQHVKAKPFPSPRLTFQDFSSSSMLWHNYPSNFSRWLRASMEPLIPASIGSRMPDRSTRVG